MKSPLGIGAIIFALAVLILAVNPSSLRAQSRPDFSLDDFSGTYYLDRDSKGVAALSVEEDMVVRFVPGGNAYGIKRAIPEAYQGHSVNLKIISVTDGAGNPVRYQAYSDSNGNKIVETGDPDIVLNSLQTYKIKYQTSGVVAIYPDRDEFLLNVNGHGWNENFTAVKAIIHLSNAFSERLLAKPTCYVSSADNQLGSCRLQEQKTALGITLNAATTEQLTAHQALIIKLDYKKGTFLQEKASNNWYQIVGAVVILMVLLGSAKVLRRPKEPR